MKHERITAAHAPNCACPRCRHLRAPAGQPVSATAAFAFVVSGWAFIFIVMPAVLALVTRLLTC